MEPVSDARARFTAAVDQYGLTPPISAVFVARTRCAFMDGWARPVLPCRSASPAPISPSAVSLPCWRSCWRCSFWRPVSRVPCGSGRFGGRLATFGEGRSPPSGFHRFGSAHETASLSFSDPGPGGRADRLRDTPPPKTPNFVEQELQRAALDAKAALWQLSALQQAKTGTGLAETGGSGARRRAWTDRCPSLGWVPITRWSRPWPSKPVMATNNSGNRPSNALIVRVNAEQIPAIAVLRMRPGKHGIARPWTSMRRGACCA